MPRRDGLATALTFAFLGTIVACGQGGDGAEPPLGRSRQAVIGGQASTEAEDAVVALHVRLPNATELCTGTLVAPNAVVTAAHCIALYPGDDGSCELTGKPDGVSSHIT